MTADALPPEAQAFQDLLNNPEPLHPDLVPYVEAEGAMGLPILRHPLVYAVPYLEVFNAHHNRQLTMKREQLARARETRNWERYIWLHERPHRFDAFLAVADEMTDAEFSEYAADVWIDSDNIRQNTRQWEALWSSPRLIRDAMMNEDERTTLDELPDDVTVWQGHTSARHDGWSWTIRRTTAVEFAQRFAITEGSRARVSEAVVPKSAILAYFGRRGEFEVIVDARALGRVRTVNS